MYRNPKSSLAALLSIAPLIFLTLIIIFAFHIDVRAERSVSKQTYVHSLETEPEPTSVFFCNQTCAVKYYPAFENAYIRTGTRLHLWLTGSGKYEIECIAIDAEPTERTQQQLYLPEKFSVDTYNYSSYGMTVLFNEQVPLAKKNFRYKIKIIYSPYDAKQKVLSSEHYF